MDVSELRKRILHALDQAGRDASARRTVVDAAAQAYDAFLSGIAVPIMRQAATVLQAKGQTYVVHAPAGSVRLASEASPQTFLEFELDVNRPQPQVVGRVSISRGRQGQIIEERPIADKEVSSLTEEDVSAFLVSELPKLVVRR